MKLSARPVSDAPILCGGMSRATYRLFLYLLQYAERNRPVLPRWRKEADELRMYCKWHLVLAIGHYKYRR